MAKLSSGTLAELHRNIERGSFRRRVPTALGGVTRKTSGPIGTSGGVEPYEIAYGPDGEAVEIPSRPIVEEDEETELRLCGHWLAEHNETKAPLPTPVEPKGSLVTFLKDRVHTRRS